MKGLIMPYAGDQWVDHDSDLVEYNTLSRKIRERLEKGYLATVVLGLDQSTACSQWGIPGSEAPN